MNLIPGLGTKQCSKKCQEEWQDRTNNESVLGNGCNDYDSQTSGFDLLCLFLICKIGVQFFLLTDQSCFK